MQPPPVKIRPLVAERKLSRRLFEQLAEQIKGGRLTPGARLPTEQELTRAARVSRTVVREAVAALRAEGLVVTRQGVGDRKSTRLNSSHSQISYAVFCLKKKKK